MNFIEFRDHFHPLGCLNVSQIRMVYPSFQANNLSRWIEKGYIVRLRKDWYAFPDCFRDLGFAFYASNRIYRPSYISCHSALAFYDMIPEAVSDITAVTTLKTARYENPLGKFAYASVKEAIFFGYEAKEFDGRTVLMATAEKALLDLLYLFPILRTEQDFAELRLDEDFMSTEFDGKRFREYAQKAGSKSLIDRAEHLLKTYVI